MTSGTRPASRGPRFDPHAYRDPVPSPGLIRLLGPLNQHVILPHVLKLRGFEFPATDLARLRAAVNPNTVAFLGPNHPEFMTDWMLDKQIAHLVSPLMAHWAAYEIVNASPLIQRFWLANRLIANVPGGGGKAYSQRTALEGAGVLLHPEGTATWQSERVGSLRPGIIEMALLAARTLADSHDRRPVFVVPVVWRLRFLGDASHGLAREMGLIERDLALPSGARHDVPQRFAALLGTLLVQRAERLELATVDFDPAQPAGYFAAQARVLEGVRARLAKRHGAIDPDIAIAQHALRRSIRTLAASNAEGARTDRALLLELQRLTRLDPRLYDVAELTQEQMAEVLKATRSALVTRGWRNVLHNTVPVAVAPRVAHVRVPEPIAIHEALAQGTPPEALLGLLQARLQTSVDALGAELAPRVAAFRRRNFLHAG